MTALTKTKLDELISNGTVQHIHGVIGVCMNYYVLFPNETQKYLYKTNKPISAAHSKLLQQVSPILQTWRVFLV